MNTGLTPEQTLIIFHNYMDYWNAAPESIVKDNTLAMLYAWEADRARIEELEKTLKTSAVRLALCNCGFHGFEDATAHRPGCPYRTALAAKEEK